VKIICKKSLNEASKILQLVEEISIQRNLVRCGSIVHINKIYETADDVKIMLQYINGGTLGNLIR
jgi:hypothetical protein